MIRRIFAILLAVALSALPVAAQFYNSGNESAVLRWRQITTQDYKVVYPEGLDSLARLYAAQLERVKIPVSVTAGYTPNQCYRKPLPVILHPWTAHANGMVAWTPSRMELYTTPDFSNPLPTPWIADLVTHESRHVSQMQFSHEKAYRVYNILFGQLFSGAMDILYCGPAFYEGDAVVAETELSLSGRGRKAEFLEYYRAAFRDGDTRNWWKWRYGSLKNYTPDHYTVGYITAAGMRSIYDAPDFTARYYQRFFNKKCWHFPLFNYQKTVKETTGKKFKEAFAEITDTLQQRWSRDEAARAPFQTEERLTPAARHYTDFHGTCILDSLIYSIRTGTAVSPELVCIAPDGVKTVRPFAHSTSQLKEDKANGRIWWSEVVSDTRWDMVTYSEIWYLDADGKRHRFQPRTRWYNPPVSPDGSRLAVTEYAWNGEAYLVVLDIATGSELERFRAPDGLQPVESEWVGNNLYVCGITDEGQGIYGVCEGFRRLLDCGNNVVKQLFVHDEALCFVSDLNGVDELYSYIPGAVAAYRISNTVGGATSFRFAPDGTMVYSAQKRDGRFVCTTAPEDLLAPVRVDFTRRHRYEFAEELAAGGPGPVGYTEVEVPESRPYRKLANAFRVHSWAPVYVDYDAVEDMSFETLTSSAGLGAIAFMQNELSTLQGSVAYNADYSSGGWTHKGEGKISYYGLYPVIELGASVSSDKPNWYYLLHSFGNFSRYLSLTHEQLDGAPYVNANLRIYLPLSFSSGGWYRGIVPQVRWGVSNNIISKGHSAPLNRLSASLRGYAVKSTPSTCVYPKLGAGAEIGWSGRPGAMGIFEPNAYIHGYGYLPGFMDTHGLRVAGTLQLPHGDAPFKERYVSVTPRGMGEYDDFKSSITTYPVQSLVTLDYAFPFAPLDWSWMGPVAYLRNLECTLHGDYGYYGGASGKQDIHTGGVGAELCMVLGNLLWIPYDTRIGVKYYYNMGIPDGLNPHQFDMVFSVDL